jgi:hypothetical protein
MTITITNPIDAIRNIRVKKQAINMLNRELKELYKQRGLCKVALARTRCNSAVAAAQLRLVVDYIEMAESTLARLEGKN